MDDASNSSVETPDYLKPGEISKRLRRVSTAIRDHDGMLIGWLADKLGDVETARDIAQEAYLRVWRYAQETDIDNPRALIFKAAANLAANEFRSRQRWRKHHTTPSNDEDHDPINDVPSSDPTPEQIVSANSDAALSVSVIDGLPDKVRRTFIMSRFEEKTYAEIAKELDVSVSSVEKYMISALQALRAAVGEQKTSTKKIIKFPRSKTNKNRTGK